MLEWIKALIYGIVEGISEWLPISSTGHLIILEEFIPLQMTPAFKSFFLVAIQLGAVLAAAVYFAKFIFGRSLRQNGRLLLLIVVSCIPAAVIGILFDDWFEEHFYNYICVSIMLALFGVIFIVTDRGDGAGKGIDDISIKDAAIIGVYQLVSAVFPGVSRSGATILGGLSRGLSRKSAAEYTFIMAIPVMAGASLLKLLKLEAAPSHSELTFLLIGAISAFIISLVVIDGLIKYVRSRSFKVFGIYRIVLAAIMLLVFLTR